MTFFEISSLTGAVVIFISLIVIGPSAKISNWLFPLGVILTLLGVIIKKDWIGLIVYLIFYLTILLLYVRKK